MRVAIVGARRRSDPDSVTRLVATLAPDDIVMSGGAIGPDRWAEAAARARGLSVSIHKPLLDGVRNRGEVARRMYERNQRVVDDSDRLVAFVSMDRTGGTEDTVRRAVQAGKLVTIIMP